MTDSETALLGKATALAGLSLAEVAMAHSKIVPEHILHAKGWTGMLLEKILGATAGHLAEPDFMELGIELKTLPLDASGLPKESTYISIVPLTEIGRMQWHQSSVYKKLKKVLWFPVEGEKAIPLGERRLGMPLLWEMDPTTEQIIRQDWEEFAERICLGEIEQITAHQGVYLQIRPKGANARERVTGIGEEGNLVNTLPRGFYLRTACTKKILQEHYFQTA